MNPQEPQQKSLFVYVREACELIGKNRVTLWRWEKRGVLPRRVHVGDSNSTTAFRREEFMRWLEARERVEIVSVPTDQRPPNEH